MGQTAVLENLTSASTVLSPDRGRVATFDREGRWLYYFRSGETFKRSLASEVHLRFRRHGRQRRRLSTATALEVSAEVLELAADVAPRVSKPAGERIRGEILRWTPEKLAEEATRFHRAYRPITILPPDQYLSVVLQATEGCTWNACTFCNFYMDRPFKRIPSEDFRQHARAVLALLGRGLRLRRGVFLADGNALALSNDRLGPLLEVVEECLPERDLFGFVDLYSGDRRSVGEWRYLAERRLRRVYVGMESGLDELLRWVDKPGTAAELAAFVRTLKLAGLQVSLIVMIGLGGEEFRQRHWQASRDLLIQLPLDDGDLIYLSPFVEHPGGRYYDRRHKDGLTAMDEDDVERDLVSLAAELRRTGLRVSRYDIREFIY